MISAEVAKRLGANEHSSQSYTNSSQQGNAVNEMGENNHNTLSNALAGTVSNNRQPRPPVHFDNTESSCPTTSGLEQAVSSLLCTPGERNTSLINTMKFDLPLDSALSEKIKKQIITREFIDLGCLLTPELDNDMKLNVSVGGDGPAIVLNNVRKATPIYNINSWTCAMHIYGSVYLRAYPEEVGPFFQYLEFIAKMARKVGFYWRQYDEAFRRARQHEYISWGTVLVNQYMSCFAAAVSGNASRYRDYDSRSHQGSENNFRRQHGKGDTFIPRSYCFALHREGECKKSNCRWEHTCFVCKGSHSILRCKQATNAQNKYINKGK